MIIDRVRGDIFKAPQRHIAFAVNTQGYNDAGFAGQVAKKIWPELANTGGNDIGDILTMDDGDKKDSEDKFESFHIKAVIYRNNWDNQRL